ncbi:MAG TPA: nitroreductase family protein [Acidimicrobiales bacterium]
MDLSDAVRRRRMVRSFSGRPVPAEVLDRALDLACRAPSAGNTGGWDAVVLAGPEQTSAFWDATTTDEWRARSRRWPGLRRAPVVVAIFVDQDAYRARYDEPDKAGSGLGAGAFEGDGAWPVPYWFVDGGFAVLVMLLAAEDVGLGACFLGNFRGEVALRQALGVPPDRRYLGAVLMGEPGGADPPSPSLARGRRRPSDVVHRGRW